MACRTTAASVVLLIVLASAASAAEPGREFTATAVVETSEGTRRMPLTVVIDRFTPPDEARALKPVLERGGQGALLAALQGRRDGRFTLGALEMPLALAVAVPTDDGYWYLLLTPRRIRVAETERGLDSLDYPFGLAVFEVGDFGRGDGELHVAAALAIDGEGYLTAADYENVPGQLLDIEKVR